MVMIGMGFSLASCDPWNNRSGYGRTDAQREYDRRAYDERIAREQDKRDRKAAAQDRRDNGDIYAIFDPPPAAWLSLDFACSGALRRAQWLICEHDDLGLLHRRLALQWEAARRTASPERLSVLTAQQHAFLSERNACEDIACVSAAYRRYLTGEARPYAPWYKAAPRRYFASYRDEPGYHRRPADRRYWHDRAKDRDDLHDRDGHSRPPPEPRSCMAEIGFAGANQLASKCDAVTPTLSSQCTVHNSCGGIRTQIDRGCRLTSDKPGFCRHF
ncbi:MAG: hypothetical protein B7Y47_12590 [Sphingomonas sp. 28-63-12]|nr:MAG: hypothetical protein B7Y47_12590 [Sphingomonas sp. 28-63-12]